MTYWTSCDMIVKHQGLVMLKHKNYLGQLGKVWDCGLGFCGLVHVCRHIVHTVSKTGAVMYPV